MTKTHAEDELKAALAELKALVARVPKAGMWTWNRSHDFKLAHASATRVANARSPARDKVITELGKLRPYYSEEKT